MAHSAGGAALPRKDHPSVYARARERGDGRRRARRGGSSSPAMAETMTMTSWPAATSRPTRLAARRMRSGVATEVPSEFHHQKRHRPAQVPLFRGRCFTRGGRSAQGCQLDLARGRKGRGATGTPSSRRRLRLLELRLRRRSTGAALRPRALARASAANSRPT